MTRSTIPEWRLFNVDPDETRDQLQQAFEMVPRMWTSERFSWRSKYFDIHDVPIVPKPYQRPHPPLWQACSSPASFVQAGRNGVGALGVTLWASQEQVRELIDLYRRAVRECTRPVGEFVNDQVAFFTFVHCADSEEEAMRNGAATAAAWYTNTAFTFFEARDAFLKMLAEHAAVLAAPEQAGLVGDFLREQAARGAAPNRAQVIIGRAMEGETVPDEEVYEALSAESSLIVGTPGACLEKMTSYAELGIDRLMCFQQVGRLPHDAVMKSIRMVGALIPQLAG
jgi:alkanesulfonate monooxygenase SsuD/methylene tetrahydromethanopterin reductase-like flavin-dependent oxidoreductase (luciferase family)